MVNTIYVSVIPDTKLSIAPNVYAFLAVHGVTLLMVTIKPMITVNALQMESVIVKQVNVPVTTVSLVTRVATLRVPTNATVTAHVNTSVKLPLIQPFNTGLFPIVNTICGMPKNHVCVNVMHTGAVLIAPSVCAQKVTIL